MIPFPDKENELAIPAVKSLKFRDTKPLKWITPDPDSIKPPSVKKFDFSKVTYTPFNTGTFKPLSTPAEETKFNPADLLDSSFDMNTLEERPLDVKTSLLLKPERIAVSEPKAKEGIAAGILLFGANQGLPSPRIDDLIEDSNGLIWIISNGKLYRYNEDYLEYFPIAGNPSLIRIKEDKSGLLWLGTDQGGGIYILNTKNGVQYHVQLQANIFSIVEDRDGIFWIGSRGLGLFFIDWTKRTIKSFRNFRDYKENATVLEILQDSKKRMWTVGDGGPMLFDLENKKITHFTTKQGLHVIRPWTVYEDKMGRIWIGGGNHNVDLIDMEQGVIRTFGAKQGFIRNGISFLQDDQQNTYLVADSSLYVLDKSLQHLKEIVINEKYKDNIWIAHTFFDRNGQIWLGTRSGGIAIIKTKGMLPSYLDESKGLAGENVWGLAEDDKKNVWVGGNHNDITRGSGFINVIDSSRTKMYNLSGMFGSAFYSVGNFMKDKQGRIWVGLSFYTIKIIDTKNNKITDLDISQGKGLQGNIRMVELDNGSILVADYQTLYLYDPVSGLIKHLDLQADKKEGFDIYCLLQDTHGSIWIGTQGSDGLYIINSTGTSISCFGAREGLIGKDVYNISEDIYGRVWIGTDKGITVIDNSKNQYFNITTAEGLINETVFSLQQVDNSMYAGTGAGLTIFKFSDSKTDDLQFRIRSFDKNQGLLYNDYHTLSLFSNDKRVWIPADSKVVTVFAEPTEDSAMSSVFINKVNILDKPQDFSGSWLVEKALNKNDTIWSENDVFFLKGQLRLDSGYLQKSNIIWDSVTGPYNIPVNMQLPYDQNYLNFHFNSVGVNKAVYRYILEGIDKNWSPASEKTGSENYRDLPPGNYTFKVRSKVENGLWSKPAEMNFTILPPWWKAWWAYLLYAVVFGAIVWSFIQFRSRWLKEENLRLEEMVTQRTDELSQKISELKTTQTQLIQSEKMASLGELTAGIAHEIQNPLNFVNNFSEVSVELAAELKDELQKIEIPADKRSNLESIADDIVKNQEKINFHGKRADNIVKGMLQHSRRSSGLKEPTDINALVDEYFRLSYHGLRAKDKSFNATMKTDFDESLQPVNIVPQDIGRAILNLFTNAFYSISQKKNTAANGYEPSVFVSTKKIIDKFNTNRVEISVKDNGNGIPQNIVDKIFQPFFTTKPTGQGTGLGLSLSYDIIKAHGGELKVITKDGEGAEFIILLPLK